MVTVQNKITTPFYRLTCVTKVIDLTPTKIEIFCGHNNNGNARTFDHKLSF